MASHLPRFLSVFFMLLVATKAQNIFDCPDDWDSYDKHCYKYVSDFPRKFDEAAAACSGDGASLLYVESAEEHNYIRNHLETRDLYQRKWLTSGHGSSAGAGNIAEGETPFVWEATSQPIKATLQFWLPGEPVPDLDPSSIVIGYVYGETGYGWGALTAGETLSYVCKIAQADSYRIVQKSRDFDYGLEVEDINVLERGPHFELKPQSVVVVTGKTDQQTVLECLAEGNPEPSYSWFRGQDFAEEVTPATDSRYTLTNGRLSIQQSDETRDAGDYRCQASNKFGTIISGTVSISFGFIGEFSNVQNAPARANAYDGVAVQCSQIAYKPAVRYQWLKDETQFIRPDMQSYIFISNNGKIYFSEVTRSDEGEYKCIAELTGLNKHTIGTSQPPTRLSLPIPLLVTDQAAKADWGPEIQNDFPAVFPQPPLRGQDIRIECFAYGSSTTPFYYSWRRSDKPMPRSAVLQDHSRVLLIPDAQLEDSGTYTCTVSRSTSARDSRSVHLSLGASPYFVAPLKNQHADVGSQLTWRCDARGQPAPTYTWYKNGQRLVTDPDSRIQVSGNVLVIGDLQADLHDGMYQCGAVNFHGAEMSNAQLRVLSFQPTFAKHPLPPQVTGAVDGDITIVCNPEGAPFPIITWSKNGATLTPDGSHVSQLANGNLLISGLSQTDTGTYTCRAENQFGEASSSTILDLATGASISVAPSDTTAVVNTTIFLSCQASRQPSADMAYVWTFNGHLIDTSLPYYALIDKQAAGQSGLYVRNVQFEHEGVYRCSVRTAFTEDYRQAYLRVRGPPGVCGGVYVDQASVGRYEVSVLWTVGTDHGSPIITFIVQAEDRFNTGVWTTVATIRAQDAVWNDAETQTGKRRTHIDGLNPGTGYRFRIIARNQYGNGVPSRPSPYTKTLDAPPAVPPRNVRGGGGSVGVLTMEWDLLDRAEWGSNDVTYQVYWRRKSNGPKDTLWQMAVKSRSDAKHVDTVGEQNYYLLYEVKVQALNVIGEGPNSTVVEVYSAEGMPVATPTNVQSDTFNSTALEVSWEPVADTREAVRGRVRGYQINYWPEELMASEYLRFIRYYGQVDTGLVIGLDVDVNTWVDVQVYNSAGLGPRSEAYIMETSGFAPLHYPQEVRVYSAGPNRARVWFRGISIITDEEGMEGYAIYYWNANEDARSATMIEVPLQTTEYILTDLDESVLYAIRIAGVNGGGYGRKSPTLYFTYEGQITIGQAFSQTIDVFLAEGTVLQSSPFLLSLMLLLARLWLCWM